jgi:hypothetical protein
VTARDRFELGDLVFQLGDLCLEGGGAQGGDQPVTDWASACV